MIFWHARKRKGGAMHGGDLVAEVLKERGVRFLFTLCGGHISPILVGAKQHGIRVVDVRHEVNAVFAADAVSRLTGVPGVAAVTAGPGVTNTITAIKNAQLAQSPLVLLGGATATMLRGRGSLQDINQLALLRSCVKWQTSVRRVRDLVPAVEKAFDAAGSGVPGPVFVECPVDLLYDRKLVESWYGAKSPDKGRQQKLSERALGFYLKKHVARMFSGAEDTHAHSYNPLAPPLPSQAEVQLAAEHVRHAKRPVMVLGSQALLEAPEVRRLAQTVERLGMPVYLSGMGRGLLGREHALQMRHKRREALREADLVLLAGVACDFRLDYGGHVGRNAKLLSVNRSPADVKKNRKPTLGVAGDPGRFLHRLLDELPAGERGWGEWLETLRRRDEDRDAQIRRQAAQPTEALNPLALCQEIDAAADENASFVADGGDFVATASYILRPRSPLSWLDPGVFGTLGVGAGFALGAKLCRPESEVWILYGDGSAAYSLAEFDTFVRHGVPVVAVVGNDACWMQIAREQVEVLGDDIGCALRHTDYQTVAEGFGGRGFLLQKPEDTAETLRRAKEAAQEGHPVLVNAHIGRTDFRKGSISM
jgi:acetolactate synthase-like protein